MEPPKIIREADPQEGRGCWMGCFGIGCLVVIIGFVGVLVGGWYGMMHTRLPLVMFEQIVEQDGKVKIEGLTGSVSKGVHIDELKFLTVDDEHWSVLRGIKFDYNGFFNMSSTGRIIVDQMSVDSGTIYADVESSEDFLFSPGDLRAMNELKDSDLSEFRVNLLQVNDLKIINLETDYSIEIETASLKNFVIEGDSGITNLEKLVIKSNMLEVSSEPSPKWPESSTAHRIRGKLAAKFSERMKRDVDFAFDLDFTKDENRRAITMFDDQWMQEFSKQKRSIQLADFSPETYFKSSQVLPSHIQLNAVHESKRADDESDDGNDETDVKDSDWSISPGASFQLGKTTFEIESVEGNSAPLRSIVGKATVNGETYIADLRCRDYFQKGRIDLKVDQQTADKSDWAQVVFGSDFASLDRDDQRMIEATIEASKDESESSEADDEKTGDDKPKAEADDDAKPVDEESPKDDAPESDSSETKDGQSSWTDPPFPRLRIVSL